MIPLICYVAHQITPNKVVDLKVYIWETPYPKERTIWGRFDPRAKQYILRRTTSIIVPIRYLAHQIT